MGPFAVPLLVFLCVAQGKLIHPGDNLRAILASASDGDVIELADGVYTTDGIAPETGRKIVPGDWMFQINKAVTVVAQNPGRVVLDGQNKYRVFNIDTVNDASTNEGLTVLDGLNITNGRAIYPGSGAGIFCFSGSLNVKRCNMYDNHGWNGGTGFSSGDGGAIFIDSMNVSISDTNIFGNDAGSGGAIQMGGANFDASLDIKNCNIYRNRATVGSGIEVEAGHVSISGTNIYKNEIFSDGNFTGGGIWLSTMYGATVTADDTTFIYDNTPDDCWGTPPWTPLASCGRHNPHPPPMPPAPPAPPVPPPPIPPRPGCSYQEKDLMYMGRNSKSLLANSTDDCCSMCMSEPGCTYYTFHQGRRCDLKDSSDWKGSKHVKGDVSGTADHDPAHPKPRLFNIYT